MSVSYISKISCSEAQFSLLKVQEFFEAFEHKRLNELTCFELNTLFKALSFYSSNLDKFFDYVIHDNYSLLYRTFSDLMLNFTQVEAFLSDVKSDC